MHKTWKRLAALVWLCFTATVFCNSNTLATEITERHDYDGLRTEATNWLSVGPAIFTSCKRIDWYQGRPLKHADEHNKPAADDNSKTRRSKWVEVDLTKLNKQSLDSSDKGFPELLSWIKKTIGYNLNCFPEKPLYAAADPINGALILYASTDADDSKWFCIPHLLSDPSAAREMYKDVLLVIPLCSDTLAKDPDTYKYRLEQLNALFTNKPGPDPAKDPATNDSHGCGEGADEVFKDLDIALPRAVQPLANRLATVPPHSVRLKELREGMEKQK